MASAWVSMNDITWPRRAPAARSSPTSRIRSVTVIDSVLKIRNAPANRATAAIKAVVAWKSVVEARRAAARSCGEDSTYGSLTSRASRADATVAGSRPGARPMSTRRDARSSRRRPGRVASGTMTVRPSAPVSGPSPATMPTTRYAISSPAPCMLIGEPSASPSWAARSLGDECAVLARVGEDGPGDEGQVVQRGRRPPDRSRGRSPAGAARPCRRQRRARGRCGARGRAPRPRRRASRRSSRPSPADSPVSLKAATRRSARPTMSRTVVLTEVSTPALVASPANRTATPSATPRMLSPTRAGRARRLRKARVVSDIGDGPTARGRRAAR